jgi:hypothetical protein
MRAHAMFIAHDENQGNGFGAVKYHMILILTIGSVCITS